MPSNFTEHYSLSQWEKSDKVLMDDFNADNAKIDGALFGKIGKPELIMSVEPDATWSNQATFDISGIDWNEWAFVFLVLEMERHLQPSNQAITATSIRFSGPLAKPNYDLSSGDKGSQWALLYVGHDADRKIFGISHSGASFYDETYRAVHKVSCSFPASSCEKAKLHVYGMR